MERHGGVRRTGLPALALLLVLVAGWTAAAARATPLVGVEENFLGPNAAAEVSLANSLFPKDATNKTARIFACWCEMETVGPVGAPAQYNFARVTQPLAMLVHEGIRPIISIIGSPDAYSSACSSDPCFGPPDGDAEWGAFWRALTGAVASSTAPATTWPIALEVWNEPNLAQFYTGGANPARYARLLDVAHDVIKDVNPSMTVLGGSIATTGTTPPGGMGDAEFLTKMYEDPTSPAKDNMDGIALKPFAGPAEPWTFNVRAKLDRMRGVRDAHGDGGKPLWVTNTGLSTSGDPSHATPTTTEQGIGLASEWRSLSAQPDIAAIVFFRLLDSPQQLDVWERGLGIFQDANTPKPNVPLFKAALAGAPYGIPTVGITASPTTVPVGGTITFTATGFPSYPDPLGTPVYHWDTDGNGTPEDTVAGTAVTASRKYTKAGTYTVGLTAQDTLELTKASITVTITAPTDGGTGGGGGDGGGDDGSVKPMKLTALSLSPSAFKALKSGPSIVAKGGTKITFTSTAKGSTKFTVKRVLPGRTVKRKCVAQTVRNRRGNRACAFLKPLPGFINRFTAVGANSFRFSGRIGGKKLGKGQYQLVATPTDSKGKKAPVRTALFRVSG